MHPDKYGGDSLSEAVIHNRVAVCIGGKQLQDRKREKNSVSKYCSLSTCTVASKYCTDTRGKVKQCYTSVLIRFWYVSDLHSYVTRSAAYNNSCIQNSTWWGSETYYQWSCEYSWRTYFKKLRNLLSAVCSGQEKTAKINDSIWDIKLVLSQIENAWHDLKQRNAWFSWISLHVNTRLKALPAIWFLKCTSVLSLLAS